MISRAYELAAHVHRTQVDKGGEPYIFHVMKVAHWCRSESRLATWSTPQFIDDVTIVAVLHDVFEDYEAGNPGDLDHLKFNAQETFGERIYLALCALTKEPNEEYASYIERVAANPIARFVKIRDLRHNMDPRRLPARDITQKDYDRWDKYRKALVRLERHE